MRDVHTIRLTRIRGLYLHDLSSQLQSLRAFYSLCPRMLIIAVVAPLIVTKLFRCPSSAYYASDTLL